MADNYLERQYDDYLRRKEADRRARAIKWQKRLKEYAKKIKEQNR